MPMPPVINPYDPRKKQKPAEPIQAVQGPITTHDKKQEPSAPAVGSSLPPMPVTQAGQPQQASQAQQRKPAVPVTYQQQAGAVADPRFSQALAQKLQQDVAAKTAALQQQQAQFQEKLTQAAGGVPAQQRIGDLLGKITSGTASEAELGEYEKLQKLQYQGPTGLEGTANIAALSQLAGSPQLLAQQYAGFAPGGVRPGDFAKAMAGLQRSPELASAQQAATGLAEKAMSAEEIAAQQAGLLKGQTEAAKTQAETAVKAEKEKYMAGLGEEARGQIEAKKGALDKLKAGLFMGQKVSQADLQKLGLSKEEVAGLKGLDISQVEGLENVQSVEDLDKAVKELQKKQIESGSTTSVLTPEQDRLIGVYNTLGGISRGQDEAAGVAYAQRGDLAKINALRRLTGQPPLKQEDIGKGAESGGISKDELSQLKGVLKSGEQAYTEEANLTIPKKQERLSGDKWYKGGLVKATDDLSKLDANTNTSNIHTIARQMYNQMQSTGANENNVYNWLKNNLGKMATGTKGAKKGKWDPKQIAQQFKDLINQNKESYTREITGRSTISKDLNIE